MASLATDPGPIPALAIVTAGTGFTALVFHALRIRPALRLRSKPIDKRTVLLHLEAS